MEKVPRIKELKEKPLLDKKDKSILKQIMIQQSFFYLRIIKRTKHISMTNRHSIKSIHDNHLGIACIAVEKVVQWRYHFKWVLFLSLGFTVTQDRIYGALLRRMRGEGGAVWSTPVAPRRSSNTGEGPNGRGALNSRQYLLFKINFLRLVFFLSHIFFRPTQGWGWGSILTWVC